MLCVIRIGTHRNMGGSMCLLPQTHCHSNRAFITGCLLRQHRLSTLAHCPILDRWTDHHYILSHTLCQLYRSRLGAKNGVSLMLLKSHSFLCALCIAYSLFICMFSGDSFIQSLQKIFTSLDFSHILMCYSLNLKWIKSNTTHLWVPLHIFKQDGGCIMLWVCLLLARTIEFFRIKLNEIELSTGKIVEENLVQSAFPFNRKIT
jgi:hypothetical protein